MFSKAVSPLQYSDQKENMMQKRQSMRRAEDHCVSIIDGQMHPVENWSDGGLLVTADERLFAIGQACTFTLKFKLRDEIMEVDHNAKVIRKASNKVALQFLPLTKKVQAGFQKIIDDHVTQRFADSHAIT